MLRVELVPKPWRSRSNAAAQCVQMRRTGSGPKQHRLPIPIGLWHVRDGIFLAVRGVQSLPMLSFFRCLLVLGVLVSAGACSPKVIPNTDVPDTPENRDILVFCERYRKAVELKNVGQLLEMAAPTYYEDGGTLDPTDDMDRAGLAEYLREKYVDVESVRYEIRYRRVSRGREDRLLVDYTFSASYRVPTADGPEWRRKVAENRLELLPSGEKFLIAAGM